MENNDFKDVRVGDKVWDIVYGWGEIVNTQWHVLLVNFKNGCNGHRFDYNGFRAEERTLFWDEVKIIPPPKPKKRVKKVVEGWTNFYENFSCIRTEICSYKIFESRERAIECRGDDYLGDPYYIKHEYWEDE